MNSKTQEVEVGDERKCCLCDNECTPSASATCPECGRVFDGGDFSRTVDDEFWRATVSCRGCGWEHTKNPIPHDVQAVVMKDVSAVVVRSGVTIDDMRGAK